MVATCLEGILTLDQPSRWYTNGRGIGQLVVPGVLSAGQAYTTILSCSRWVVIFGGSTAACLEQRVATHKDME